MTRGGDSYAAAKQTLLKWLRADLHGEAGVEALIDVVHGVTAEADPILVTDVVEALAGEERMAQTLTRISKKKLRHGARDDALALALFKRAGGSQNPAYLTALLGYLGALQKRDGSPVGVGYDALVANFAEVERAREFMWDNRIPAPGTDRRQALIEALAGHPGDRLAASLESKSVAHRSLAIAVALKLDQPNAAVMDLAVQQALVTSLSAIVTRDLEHEGWLDPVAELAGQAWQRPAALLALVDAVLGRKGHAEAARDALLDLLTGRAVALDAARIEALVSLVTSADPVYGVFDLLEQLDLTPVVDRMVRLLSDDLRGIPAGYALIGRAPDALLQDLAGRLGKRIEPDAS